MMIPLPARLAGAVWGHLVGDAVGVPYEFRSADAIGEVVFGAGGMHGQPAGTWSDDGALMLALLDSLLEVGFDVDDQGRRALAWRRDRRYTPEGEPLFDIGSATSAALDALEQGVPAEQAGRTDERACGNGSLMRILPLALVDRTSEPGELVDRAHRASRVTHGHPRAQVACALYVLVARALLRGEVDRAAALEASVGWLRGHYAATSAEHAAALEHLLDYEDRGGRGRVWDSFWSAWDAFAGAGSYADTIRRAVAYGNDTDTTAAIAGGLAGIHWGIDGIPADWLAGMRDRTQIRGFVDRLAATDGWRTSTAKPLRVDWVEVPAKPGQLGMTFLPGKQRDGWAGKHWRDLEADVARLVEEDVQAFLLLVEDHELEAARVPRLGEAMAGQGIEVRRHPIVDMTADIEPDALRATLAWVEAHLAAGRNVVVACRGGLGRTGTVVACLLRQNGLSADEAMARTRAARRNTIESGVQAEFVHAWRRTGTRGGV